MNKYRNCKKIVIIGFTGSGKSTLALQLGSILRIEVFHIASIMWRPGWVHRPVSEWKEMLAQIIQKEAWIIEGKGKIDIREVVYDLQFPEADVIIFLDFPKSLCLWRICKRSLQYLGKYKPELSSEYPERFRGSLAKIKRFWKNFERDRLVTLQKLNDYSVKENQMIIVLKKPSEVRSFLSEVKA